MLLRSGLEEHKGKDKDVHVKLISCWVFSHSSFVIFNRKQCLAFDLLLLNKFVWYALKCWKYLQDKTVLTFSVWSWCTCWDAFLHTCCCVLCAYTLKKQQNASYNRCYLVISKLQLWMDERRGRMVEGCKHEIEDVMGINLIRDLWRWGCVSVDGHISQ